MSSPQLNQDQQDAVKAVSSFIISDKKEFLLTGGPGVGKTFTTRRLAEILPDILKNYYKSMGKKGGAKEVVLTSTTNKAAAVLAEQTGFATSTIHSFLGIIPKKSGGRTVLKTTNKWQVHSNIILFIDEASMIDFDLYQYINQGTDDSCKIIYIGDKNQLPPVMEKLSPSMTLASQPDDHYEITTPVRNANAPGLMDLCNRLREDILVEKAKGDLTNWPAIPDELIHLEGPEFQKLVEDTFGPNGTVKETDEDLACRILCYTNRSVIAYNQYIRKLRGLPEHPVAGEKLVCNSHFQASREQAFNVEEVVSIHAVGDLTDVPVCGQNTLSARPVTVSSQFIAPRDVWVVDSIPAFRHLKSHYKKHSMWKEFYKMDDLFIDLRNREAATVYKAQGSTYDSVILVMGDIFSSRDINQLRRMLYVGASRARNKVYVYEKDISLNKRGIYK